MHIRNAIKHLLVSHVIMCLYALTALADRPVVGFSLPLSGMVAGFGEGFRRGLELYQVDHSQLPFDISIDDSQYDGKRVASSYQALRSVKKADSIVVWGNTPSEVAAPLAARDSQQLITVSGQPVAKDRPTVVNFGFRAEDFANKVVAFAEDKQFKNFSIVSVNLGSALDIIKLIKAKMPLQDILVETSTTDFIPTILKLKATKVDGLILFLLPDAALTFARQAQNAGFSVPTVGGDIFADDDFQKKIAQIMPELSLIYGGANSKFIDRTRAKFGDASYYFETASAYSILGLLDAYYTQKERPLFSEWAKNAAIPSTAPVQALSFSNSADYGAMYSCTFAISKVLK